MESSSAAPADIPPVVAPPVDANAKAEASDFSSANATLDLRVRRIVAYGAIVLVALMYASGLCVIYRVVHPPQVAAASKVISVGAQASAASGPAPMGVPLPAPSPVVPENAPLVAAITALFSVPTVLVITLLRSVTRSKENGAEGVAQFLGDKVVGMLEKFVQR